jgi:hypothetical protein
MTDLWEIMGTQHTHKFFVCFTFLYPRQRRIQETLCSPLCETKLCAVASIVMICAAVYPTAIAAVAVAPMTYAVPWHVVLAVVCALLPAKISTARGNTSKVVPFQWYSRFMSSLNMFRDNLSMASQTTDIRTIMCNMPSEMIASLVATKTLLFMLIREESFRSGSFHVIYVLNSNKAIQFLSKLLIAIR